MFLRDDGEARVLKTGSEAWRDSRVEEADTIRVEWRKGDVQRVEENVLSSSSGTEVYKIFIYIHLKKHPCFLKINISYPYYEGHATIKIISESSDLLWKATR